MKIIRLGKQTNNEKLTGKRFDCPYCGCGYVASDKEYSYCSEVYPHYYCKCPNCHAENWYRT